MKNVELYYNDDRSAYAVLISSGYGSGRSSWNSNYPELVYDRRVVEWYLEHENDEAYLENVSAPYNVITIEKKEANKFFRGCGYNNIYYGGLKKGMIHWIPIGTIWRVKEYDGAECIETLELKEWYQF